MTDLSSFQITKKWPPKNSDVIQLYSLTTPNGIKISAMLEETGLDYEAHFVNFGTQDQMTPEFLSLNPNNKIPAIIDPNGPNGEPMGLWETGAIMLYLADKSGKLISADPVERAQTIQWLMWQMGGLGPMFGQFGFFHKFAGKDMEDKTPFNRYRDESKRLLSVLDQHLDGREFIVGNELSIADMAVWPWIRAMTIFYKAGDIMEFDKLSNVKRWYEPLVSRPASLKAVTIPSKD